MWIWKICKMSRKLRSEAAAKIIDTAEGKKRVKTYPYKSIKKIQPPPQNDPFWGGEDFFQILLGDVKFEKKIFLERCWVYL